MKNKLKKILKYRFHGGVAFALSIVLTAGFSMAVSIYAAPPTSEYFPGETLDPSTCGPGDPNCTVSVEPALTTFDTISTSAYTIDSAGHTDQVIYADSSSNDIVITLPAISSVSEKRTLIIEKTSDFNSVYINSAVGDFINNTTALQVVDNRRAVKIESIEPNQWAATFNFDAFSVSPLTVRAATDVPLPANTYDNGASGVGASLTASTNGALPLIDGIGLAVGNRVLVKEEIAAHNGVYQVASLGSGGTPWVLTRTTDSDQTAELDPQIVIPTEGSPAYRGRQFTQRISDPIIGTVAIKYTIKIDLPCADCVTIDTAMSNQIEGQIPFWTMNTNEISGGNQKFFWDNPNSRLGLGTNVPNSSLEILGGPGNSSSANLLYISATNVPGTASGYGAGTFILAQDGAPSAGILPGGLGGSHLIAGGNGGSGSGSATGGGGGTVSIFSGNGGSSSATGGNGGTATITTGNGGAGDTIDGSGGTLNIITGDAADNAEDGSAHGGDLSINTGSSAGGNRGGSISFTTGSGLTDGGGSINLTTAARGEINLTAGGPTGDMNFTNLGGDFNFTDGGSIGGFNVIAGNGGVNLSSGSGGDIVLTANNASLLPQDGGDVIINPAFGQLGGVDGNIILANLIGNVGIGTASPGYPLHVKGDVGGVTAKFENASGAQSCTINPSVSGAITCTSDKTLKRNITGIGPINSTLAKILQLQPVSYEWLSDKSGTTPVFGFLAQQVQPLFPNLVTYDKETGKESFAMVGLIPPLTQALKEVNAKIDRAVNGVPIVTQDVVDQVAEFFSGNTEKIIKGLTKVYRLTVGTPSNRTGITVYDTSSGDPFCISVASGQIKNTAGECEVTRPSRSGGGGGGGSSEDSGGTPQCSDGIDNDEDTDGDGLIDYPDDPGCSDATDESEEDVYQCSDGIDNDGDGFTDFPADTGCANGFSIEAPACSDGIDNEGDGFTDFPDDTTCLSPSGITEGSGGGGI